MLIGIRWNRQLIAKPQPGQWQALVILDDHFHFDRFAGENSSAVEMAPIADTPQRHVFPNGADADDDEQADAQSDESGVAVPNDADDDEQEGQRDPDVTEDAVFSLAQHKPARMGYVGHVEVVPADCRQHQTLAGASGGLPPGITGNEFQIVKALGHGLRFAELVSFDGYGHGVDDLADDILRDAAAQPRLRIHHQPMG